MEDVPSRQEALFALLVRIPRLCPFSFLKYVLSTDYAQVLCWSLATHSKEIHPLSSKY